ncbi:MAG: HEAT repeat domain-containing protein [Gammaproteobacteria bacterium]
MTVMKINKVLKIAIFTMLLVSIGYIYKNNHGDVSPIIDIHGSATVSAAEIKKKHLQEFKKIAAIMQSNAGLNSASNNILMSYLLTNLVHDIKQENKLGFVHISPIIYPGDSNTYVTIDVIEASNASKQPYFLKKPVKTIKDPDHLIDMWLEYEKKGFSFFYREKKFPIYQSCPAYHCLFGFDLEPFKKYEAIFNRFVEKDKFELMTILKEDKDSQKRAAAAFLMAHIKNADELVSILLPSIYDADANVRNNVMRVLGMVLLNNKNINLTFSQIANILDFPLSTDRNKGMLILLGLSSRPKATPEIIHYFGEKLLAELKQQQPNNHNLSYAILKNISGKQYTDRDYSSWSQWLAKSHASAS